MNTCPHPAFQSWTNRQTYRLYRKAHARMSRGDGYQPFGYDWVTVRLTRPGWYAALRLIGQAHNYALKHTAP